MTSQEINAMIASAPKSTEEMLANRRAYLLRETIKDAKATPADFADWLGVSRLSIVQMIERKEVTTIEFVGYANRFLVERKAA